MSEISKLASMDRGNSNVRLHGRYALIRQHPLLTIAFVLLFAPPVSKAISLLSPLLISIALCFIALVVLGPQLERIGTGKKINLKRKMAGEMMPNGYWQNNLATNDEKSMKGKDSQKSKEISLMRGPRKLRRTNMANRSDCSLEGRELIWYREGKPTQVLDEDRLKVDFSRKDGGLASMKKNRCHNNVLNMSEGESERCVIIGSVRNLDTNDTARSSLSVERYTSIPELEAGMSESEAESVFLMASSPDVTACNRRCEPKTVPKVNVKEASGDQVKGLSDFDGTVDKHQIHPPEHGEAGCLEGNKIEEDIQSVSRDINKKFIWGSDDSHKIDEELPIASSDPYILEEDISWQENPAEKFKKVKPNHHTLNQRVHEEDASSFNNHSMSAKLDLGTDCSQVTLSLDSEFQEVPVPSFWNASRKQFPGRKLAGYTLTEKEEDGGGKGKNAIKGRNSDKCAEFLLLNDARMDITHGKITMKQNVDNYSKARPLQKFALDGTELVSASPSTAADLSVSNPKFEITNKSHLPHSSDCQPIIIFSSDTLIREQEMDLLWQEYDQTSRRNTNATADEKEDPKTKGEENVHQATGTISVNWKQAAEALQAYTDQDQDNQREGSVLQKGHDTLQRGCWQFRGRRSIRRSLLRFSRALKGFGLTQCIQSSKVNN